MIFFNFISMNKEQSDIMNISISLLRNNELLFISYWFFAVCH